jgi:DNA-directed RNA polymerase subunit RPC12/RpoP
MKYRCPSCGEEFDPSALQKPGGVGGGLYCPRCQQRVYVSLPYGAAVGIISLLISLGVLSLMHIRNIIWFIAGTIVIWIPVSMFINLWSTRLKPPVLKKWRPRRTRSFFEWLYERDAPQDLLDKRPPS